MCGIIGYSGAFTETALRQGLAAIHHRGPEDTGVFIDAAAKVGLGHARLSIVDLSPLGRQPMAAVDGRVQLVFNGAIYYYGELRRELEAKRHAFRGHSDTGVLLYVYLQKGEAFLSRLNGIFAMAIFDRRSKSMLIARDAKGVKPLYVTATDRGVAFASEIKGLLALVAEARELDVASAVAGMADHVRTAVQRQLVAVVPVSAFLSGGLDSTVITIREAPLDIARFTSDVKDGAGILAQAGRFPRDLKDRLCQAHGERGGGVSAVAPGGWRRHPSHCVHHRAGLEPGSEDPRHLQVRGASSPTSPGGWSS